MRKTLSSGKEVSPSLQQNLSSPLSSDQRAMSSEQCIIPFFIVFHTLFLLIIIVYINIVINLLDFIFTFQHYILLIIVCLLLFLHRPHHRHINNVINLFIHIILVPPSWQGYKKKAEKYAATKPHFKK